MGKSARDRTFLTLLSLLAAGTLVPQAIASSTVVNYAYSGKIISTANVPSVVVGDTITGTFSYDSTQSGNATTGNFTFTGSSKAHTFTLKIFNSSNQQVFSDSYSGNSTAYYFGQVAYVSSSLTNFNIEGDTVYKQGLGITKQNGDIAFNLALSDTSGAGGFTPTNQPLPTITTIKDFVSNTGLLTWDPPNQTFMAQITSFSDLNSVPEPSTGMLWCLAIGVCALASVILRHSQGLTRAARKHVAIP
jgi:hypothetical protein